MKYSKRKEKKRQKIKNAMLGEGVFVYENNTDADLYLPKPSIEGFKVVGPRKRFTGDSYFLSLVKTPICLLRLIEEVKPSSLVQSENIKEEKEEKKEEKKINKVRKKKSKRSKKATKGKKMKEKLILDQPEVVTKSGKLEQEENVEEQQEATQEEKLLTENPSGNIEIISE